MGDINIDLDAIRNGDRTLIEVANELRDISIRANQLEWTYVGRYLGITDQIVKANNYISSACDRTVNLRDFMNKMVGLYETTETQIVRAAGGKEAESQHMQNTLRTMSVSQMATNSYGNWRVQNLNNRFEEEDYGYSIQYIDNDGSIETLSYYKNYEREYVGAEYDQETGKLIAYDVRKQYIGSGQSREYIFSDNRIYKIDKLKDVRNYYDGNEKEKVKSGIDDDYDVKSEFIDSINSKEVIENGKAAQMGSKVGVKQNLTNWDVEKSNAKVGGVIGTTTKDFEDTITYMSGDDLTDKTENWDQKRTFVATGVEKTLVGTGYLAADLLTGEAGGKFEDTLLKIDTKYEFKGEDSIHSIEGNFDVGTIEGGVGAGLGLLNGDGKFNLNAYLSGELKLSVLDAELKYSETDFAGNELDSIGVEGSLFTLGIAGNVGIEDNKIKPPSDSLFKVGIDAGVDGSLDVINRVWDQKDVNVDLFGKKDNK